MFLYGLEKLGKGDWRGISRNFVTTRTPTQVASHAQKYFLRQSSLNKRKRRFSLFDMCPLDTHVNILSFIHLSCSSDQELTIIFSMERTLYSNSFYSVAGHKLASQRRLIGKPL